MSRAAAFRSSALSWLGAPVGWLGRCAVRAVTYVLDLTYFIFTALGHWRRGASLANRATRETLYTQVIFTGVDALGLITVLALAVALAITSQILVLGQAFGTEQQVVSLLIQLVGFHLATLLTAFALVGRSGSAIAVDLGNMKLRGEVEGLELLGISISDYLVAPRLIGTAIAQLVLASYFAAIALFGGVLIAGVVLGTGALDYVTPLARGVAPYILGVFVVKNLVFGLLVGGSGCFHGLRVRRSPTELPQGAQAAIVNGLILVFVAEGVLAVLVA